MLASTPDGRAAYPNWETWASAEPYCANRINVCGGRLFRKKSVRLQGSRESLP
jgi:hypothetical protein